MVHMSQDIQQKEPKLPGLMRSRSFTWPLYLELQSTQKNGPGPNIMGVWPTILGTLEVQVVPFRVCTWYSAWGQSLSKCARTASEERISVFMFLRQDTPHNSRSLV